MFRSVYAILVFLILASLNAFAHGQDAQIQGQVLDPTGAGVPKALVRVVDQQTSTERKVQTNDTGQYIVAGLTPGLYNITVESPGFTPAGSDQITLNAGQSSVFDFTLKTSAASTDIIVTAEKTGEERLQDTPIPISVIDAEELANTGVSELRNYYTKVPGVGITSDTYMWQEIGIRGIWETSANPTTAVLVDNIPFSGATANSGNTQVDIDPGDLARIEVLRGPQGTLYGANSMGGLLRYVTKDPSTTGVSGRIEVGTNHVYNGAEPGFNWRGSVNIPVTSKFAIRASAFTRQDAGYIDNIVQHIKGINKVQAYGARTSALWHPSDSAYLKLFASYQDTHGDGLSEIVENTNGYLTRFASAFPPSVAATLFPVPGDLQQNYVTGVGGYSVIAQTYGASLKLKLRAVDFSSDTGYEIQRSVAPFDFTPFFGSTYLAKGYGVYGAPMTTDTNLNKISEEPRLSGRMGRADWVAGGFYTHEGGSPPDQKTIYEADAATGQKVGIYYHANINDAYDEYAGFGNITYHVTERFDIQGGLRQSHLHEITDLVREGPLLGTTVPQLTNGADSSDFLTYLFTPRFRISKDIMAYARFASGFRPGGFNTLPPTLNANTPASFGPDKTYDYEGGLKGEFFDQHLSIDTSLYYIDWEKMQIQLAVDAFPYIANAGNAKSEGIEFSFTARPLTKLKLSGWFDYDDAALKSDFPATSTAYGVKGNELPSTAKLAGQLSPELYFQLHRTTLGFLSAEENYTGDRLSPFPSCGPATSTSACGPAPRSVYPSYYKTDLRAGIEHGSWTASVYANNVTDVRGVVNGGLGYYTPYVFIVVTPRTVGLSVTKTF